MGEWEFLGLISSWRRLRWSHLLLLLLLPRWNQLRDWIFKAAAAEAEDQWQQPPVNFRWKVIQWKAPENRFARIPPPPPTFPWLTFLELSSSSFFAVAHLKHRHRCQRNLLWTGWSLDLLVPDENELILLELDKAKRNSSASETSLSISSWWSPNPHDFCSSISSSPLR